MSYQVFARKYRPRTFDDVLGQDHVVTTLRNAIEADRLAHAYLFVGPRGTGKTSTARIFAKALNCSNGPRLDFDPDEEACIEIAEGRSLDVLEIDGASNNGVDQVRELRETVNYAPASSRFKIYYIDEVHMLSTAAFNALLKTLEEPPPHVKFIFATTEPNKILPTIISRCQRFDLRPIPMEVIARQLQNISDQENVTLEQPAAWSIAKGADGGMRDAQSMLDQLVAFCGDTITEENVQDIFGFTSSETISSLATHLLRGQTAESIALVQAEADRGKDLTQLLSELAGFIRALLLDRLNPDTGTTEIPAGFWDQIGDSSALPGDERLLGVLDRLANADARMRRASNKQLHFEIAMIRAIQSLDEVQISDVIRSLKAGNPAEANPVASLQAQPAETPPVVQAPSSEASSNPPSTARSSARAKKKSRGVENQLESLIEQAPENHPEPAAPNSEGSAGESIPKELPSPAAAEANETGAPKDQDAFYDDPLVREALDIFKGKLKD
ncbi:MAG: DNA polymerase III subunit gamma/tau [Roseibacillus sp.]|nr:DNA polymerase III subunit gamma/tau [Roseibacillus sp.]